MVGAFVLGFKVCAFWRNKIAKLVDLRLVLTLTRTQYNILHVTALLRCCVSILTLLLSSLRTISVNHFLYVSMPLGMAQSEGAYVGYF